MLALVLAWCEKVEDTPHSRTGALVGSSGGVGATSGGGRRCGRRSDLYFGRVREGLVVVGRSLLAVARLGSATGRTSLCLCSLVAHRLSHVVTRGDRSPVNFSVHDGIDDEVEWEEIMRTFSLWCTLMTE